MKLFLFYFHFLIFHTFHTFLRSCWKWWRKKRIFTQSLQENGKRKINEKFFVQVFEGLLIISIFCSLPSMKNVLILERVNFHLFFWMHWINKNTGFFSPDDEFLWLVYGKNCNFVNYSYCNLISIFILDGLLSLISRNSPWLKFCLEGEILHGIRGRSVIEFMEFNGIL